MNTLGLWALLMAMFIVGVGAQVPRPKGWDEGRMAAACIAAGAGLAAVGLLMGAP